jgi:hypothetical protein
MAAPILRFDRYSSPEPHILPLAPRVALEITRGRVQQRIRPVRGRVFLIGTASDCDLVLGDLSFPEAYAYLFVQDSHIAVRRLGSGPELMVSGEVVEAADVQNGDRISFGPFELRVVIEDCSRKQETAMSSEPVIHSIY